MSAIAGILYFDGAAVAPGLIRKLTAAMTSRGPDGCSHWEDGPLALGHCMLRATPESLQEVQPLSSPDGNLRLVWDGRLDNREELKRQLTATGVVLRDESDAELVLQSHATWGEECPRLLLGDFAYAVWDLRTRTLYCARDHMGGRQFHYTCNDRFFAFASDDEALLQLPRVARGPNRAFVAHLLCPDYTEYEADASWLKDVRTLLPATCLSVTDSNDLRRHVYWDLQPGEPLRFGSDAECQEAFLSVFGAAVTARLRARGDVALMMSGGLDSAGILGMARRLLPGMGGKQLHAYSAIADDAQSCVETRCILGLAEALGSNAHQLSLPSFTGMATPADLKSIASTLSNPVEVSILMPELMYLAAARNGHRVMLHGASGDLTMATPMRYPAWHFRRGDIARGLAECWWASRNHVFLRQTGPGKLLLQNLWSACLPESMRARVRGWRAARRPFAPLSGLINPAFAAELQLAGHVAASQSRPAAPARTLQHEQINCLLPPGGIVSCLTGMNRVAARHGIEARDPWGDRRVVEFFLRLPLHHKVRHGWTKYLVRSTFDELPAGVRCRTGKEHVGWHVGHRLLLESAEFFRQDLEHENEPLGCFVAVDELRRLYEDYLQGPSDVARQALCDTMALALWLRRIN